VSETAEAIVQGTVLAVERAHGSLKPGFLSLGNVTIQGGNRNRSPSAYLANPADERARYDGDQDTALTLLKFTDAGGVAKGFLSFFPVHGTSLYEVRHFLPQDDIGMAAHP
jgi:neutral ceramidase